MVQRWLGRGHELGSVAVLGRGLDHVAYEVNGEIVVRWSRGAEDVRREAELLAAVAEVFTLPVPEVVFVDPDAGALAYRKLPGVPLLGRDLDHPEWFGPPLGEALTALHGADPGRFEGLLVLDREPPGVPDLGPDVLEGVLARYGRAWRDRDRERAVFYAAPR